MERGNERGASTSGQAYVHQPHNERRAEEGREGSGPSQNRDESETEATMVAGGQVDHHSFP